MKLSSEVEAIATDGEVSAQAIQDLSSKLKTAPENVYAGLGMSFETRLTLEHDLQFVLCVGNCRDRGSLDCANTLLEIKGKRETKELSSFDLVPQQCLSRCQEGPVVEIRSKDGNAVLPGATPKSVAQAVAELLE
jgi:NADH:ubiquinone oxidoreductase subunit E